MLDVAQEVINRELASLLATDNTEDLLFEVRPFLAVLEQDAQLRAALTDLASEADDLGRQLRDDVRDGANVRTLEEIWGRIRDAANQGRARDYAQRNAEFQRLTASDDAPVVVALHLGSAVGDSSRMGRLAEIVASFAEVLGDADRAALDGVAARCRHRRLEVIRATHAHSAVSLLRLRLIAALTEGETLAEAASSPRRPEERPALVVRADAHGSHWQGLADRVLLGDGVADLDDAAGLDRTIRRSCRRVAADLRVRVGSTATRLALIERYKARCEWHDRERLLALANAATGKSEAALRDDLARYLFDAGLDPLSEVRLGVVRADLLADAPGASFLLEAKQYSDRAGIASALRQAFRQALDTAARLSGGGFAIQEAFVVLFRRGGPRALLPREAIFADGVRWHLQVIDLAGAEVTASRNSHTPIEWTANELRGLLVESAEEARAQRQA